MNKTIKTLAIATAVIGLATVIKRVQKQSYSNEGIKVVPIATSQILNTSDYIRGLWKES